MNSGLNIYVFIDPKTNKLSGASVNKNIYHGRNHIKFMNSRILHISIFISLVCPENV